MIDSCFSFWLLEPRLRLRLIPVEAEADAGWDPGNSSGPCLLRLRLRLWLRSGSINTDTHALQPPPRTWPLVLNAHWPWAEVYMFSCDHHHRRQWYMYMNYIVQNLTPLAITTSISTSTVRVTCESTLGSCPLFLVNFKQKTPVTRHLETLRLPTGMEDRTIFLLHEFLPAATKLWPRLCFYSCLSFC